MVAGRPSVTSPAGVVFYVRENLAPAGGHFAGLSGGERQAWKEGRVAKRHLQVLELCCPAEWWEAVADVVRRADALGRPVRRNARFTAAWAERKLSEARRQ